MRKEEENLVDLKSDSLREEKEFEPEEEMSQADLIKMFRKEIRQLEKQRAAELEQKLAEVRLERLADKKEEENRREEERLRDKVSEEFELYSKIVRSLVSLDHRSHELVGALEMKKIQEELHYFSPDLKLVSDDNFAAAKTEMENAEKKLFELNGLEQKLLAYQRGRSASSQLQSEVSLIDLEEKDRLHKEDEEDKKEESNDHAVDVPQGGIRLVERESNYLQTGIFAMLASGLVYLVARPYSMYARTSLPIAVAILATYINLDMGLSQTYISQFNNEKQEAQQDYEDKKAAFDGLKEKSKQKLLSWREALESEDVQVVANELNKYFSLPEGDTKFAAIASAAIENHQKITKPLVEKMKEYQEKTSDVPIKVFEVLKNVRYLCCREKHVNDSFPGLVDIQNAYMQAINNQESKFEFSIQDIPEKTKTKYQISLASVFATASLSSHGYSKELCYTVDDLFANTSRYISIRFACSVMVTWNEMKAEMERQNDQQYML